MRLRPWPTRRVARSGRAGQTSGLREMIFQHYARSALLPILTIEVLLLGVYFASNAYHAHQTETTLKDEATVVLPHLATKTADGINDQFAEITRQTRYYASAHADLFSHPEAYGVTGDQPVFAKAHNGTTYQTNRPEGSSLFISAKVPQDERQMFYAARTAALDPLSRHMVEDVPDVAAAYVNTPGNMNRLYPHIDKVYDQYPAAMSMADYNFYYLADAEHDPQRKPVWTGVYLDPAGHGWMLSCVAPVYSTPNRFEGVVGLDITVDNLVNNVLHMNLPWGASAFMVDQNGMILAMTSDTERLLGLTELKSHVYDQTISKEQLKPDEFNLLKSADPAVAKAFTTVLASSAQIHELSLAGEDLMLVQSVIGETGWRLMVTVKKTDMYASVNRLSSLTRTLGAIIVLGMLLFYAAFFFYLRRQARRMAAGIAEPVAHLTRATEAIGTGQSGGDIAHSDIAELNRLTDTFNIMSRELDHRSKELVATQVRAEVRQKEAELAFARGRYESASGYLHNVGNAMTRFDSSLMDIEELLRSTEQYPTVFNRIRSGDQQVMDKFQEILLNRTLPRLRTVVEDMTRTKTVIQQTIAHQQADFNESHDHLAPVEFDVSDLVDSLCDDLEPQMRESRLTMVRAITPNLVVLGHSHAVRSGVHNLLNNARQATPAGGTVTVTCAPRKADDPAAGDQVGDDVTIAVHDTGCGIPAEVLPKVMSAGFTTKPTGHGLGLHSFAVYLSAQGGRLTVTSDGQGSGTTVTAEVPHG